MGYFRPTTRISRADLIRDCLQELHLWPGCEKVVAVGTLADSRGKLTVQVIDYGLESKKLADRALRCIQREERRRYHLKMD
jgi:hypothetical protein